MVAIKIMVDNLLYCSSLIWNDCVKIFLNQCWASGRPLVPLNKNLVARTRNLIFSNDRATGEFMTGRLESATSCFDCSLSTFVDAKGSV